MNLFLYGVVYSCTDLWLQELQLNTVAARCNEFGRNELPGYNELGVKSQPFLYYFILNEHLK